jgi:hypothetical protein
MAGPGKGGRNLTNTPKLKGAAAPGTRPAGSSAVVPNAQYPTVLGTKRLPGVPGVIMNEPGAAINGSGDVTVNSTPEK